MFSSLQFRRLLAPLVLGLSLLTTGCASAYLDPATKDVPVAQLRKPAHPQPVRLNFEFQTRGAPNAPATTLLKGAVEDQVKTSGLFAGIEGAPNAAVLDIKINNIPLNDDSPAAKGFVTGFTFGLVGSSVSDGYECKLSYLAPGATQPVTKLVRHAIHTTLGNASPPPGTIQMPSIKDAVMGMAHAAISNALRDLSVDPAFADSATTLSANS